MSFNFRSGIESSLENEMWRILQTVITIYSLQKVQNFRDNANTGLVSQQVLSPGPPETLLAVFSFKHPLLTRNIVKKSSITAEDKSANITKNVTSSENMV